MDNFSVIYKILVALERSMDLPAFDIEELGIEGLKVSHERLNRNFEMLQDAGLIKGADLSVSITGDTFLKNPKRIRITLKGLEYLQENSIMQKMYRAAKGITDLIP